MNRKDNQEFLYRSVEKLKNNGYEVIDYSCGCLPGDVIPMQMSSTERKTFKELLPLVSEVEIDRDEIFMSLPTISTEFYLIFADIDALPSKPEGFETIGNKLYAIISYVEDSDTFLNHPDREAFLPNYKIERDMLEKAEIIANWVNTFCA